MVHLNGVLTYSYDLPELLKKVSDDAATVYKNTEEIRRKSMMAPGVTTYIMAGNELNTENSYKYTRALTETPEKNYPFYQVELPASQKFSYPDYYNGDGTMPKFALEYPIFWSKHQPQPVYYQFFVGAEHSKIMSMEGPIKHIVSILE